MRIWTAGLFLALIPAPALAESCLPFLTPRENVTGTSITMSTLNKNGVASFSIGSLVYRPPLTRPRPIPARWTSQVGAPVKQFFSDRAATTPSEVGFDPARSDQLSVSISVAASPAVEIRLRSWGNAAVRFTGTCSAGGVIHGSTPDVDYLITVHQNTVL